MRSHVCTQVLGYVDESVADLENKRVSRIQQTIQELERLEKGSDNDVD